MMYQVEKRNQKTGFAHLSIIVFLVFTSCASTKVNTSNGPLVVQEQGNFAVGGTVISAPSTFDPVQHGAFNPANESSEGLAATCL